MPGELLKILDSFELDIFTAEDFLNKTGTTLNDWQNPLRTLIGNGLIEIIEKGKYCRHPKKKLLHIGRLSTYTGFQSR